MAIEHDNEIELHTLCVAPEHQRQGIGTEMIRQMARQAHDQHRKILLSVLKPNTAARALYERLDFVVTEETAHHYRMCLVP